MPVMICESVLLLIDNNQWIAIKSLKLVLMLILILIMIGVNDSNIIMGYH